MKKLIIISCTFAFFLSQETSVLADLTNRFDKLITLDGQEFTNVKAIRIDRNSLVIIHSKGIGKIPINNLSDDVRIATGLLSRAQ